jgi:hypothetical protein
MLFFELFEMNLYPLTLFKKHSSLFLFGIQIADKDAKYATMLNEYGCKIMTTFDWLKPGYKKNIFPGVARPYYRV